MRPSAESARLDTPPPRSEERELGHPVGGPGEPHIGATHIKFEFRTPPNSDERVHLKIMQKNPQIRVLRSKTGVFWTGQKGRKNSPLPPEKLTNINPWSNWLGTSQPLDPNRIWKVFATEINSRIRRFDLCQTRIELGVSSMTSARRLV